MGLGGGPIGETEACDRFCRRGPHPCGRGRAGCVPAWGRAAAELGVPVACPVISPFVMRLAGIFTPAARESVGMLFEFSAPFVVDFGRITEAFGLTATPVAEGLRRTAVWWKEQVAA